MATPLRWGMKLPDGTPLRYGMPGLRWDGTLEEVVAAIEQENSKKTMSKNLISAAMSAQALTNIQQAVATIRANLPLVQIPPEERHKLANVTEATQGVVRASINFVAQHAEAIPSLYSLTEFNKDATLLDPAQQAFSLIENLHTDASQMIRALYADLYAETLDIYAYAKAANRNGAYDDYINTVKTRFSTGPRAKTKSASKPA